jgi:hypothetical protein
MTLYISLFGAQTAIAQEDVKSYRITSSQDQFTLKSSLEGGWTLQGKPVSLDPLSPFAELFFKKMEVPCDPTQMEKSDVKVVIRTHDNKTLTRKINLDKSLVSDGKNCMNVTGNALLYFPLHRNWFSGEKRMSFPKIKSLEIRLPKEKFKVRLQKRKGQWQEASPEQFVNWPYIEKLLAALTTFNVHKRSHPRIVEGLRSVILRINGDREYIFYEMPNYVWAIHFPSVKWLITTADFGVLGAFDKTSLLDAQASELKTLVDSKATNDARITALRSVGERWSRSIATAYHQVLFDTQAPLGLKERVVYLLKHKPSDENIRALLKALKNEGQREVQTAITKALRVRYPKGPEIHQEDDLEEVQGKIDKWKNWERRQFGRK